MKISEEQQELYDCLAEWAFSYQQGDQRAFANIYNATFRHVFTYVKLHEIPENEREDLVQDIYITVAQNLATLKEPQAFFKWLMRITANKVVDYFRKNKKRLETEVFETEKQDDASGAEEQLYRQQSSKERTEDEMISVPENILDNKETQKILFSLVKDSLKPIQVEIIYLRCYNEKTFKEIAEELGVPESTVKTQFRRSLDKIQTAILKMEKEQEIRLHSVGVIPFVAGMLFVYANAKEASAAEISAIYAGIQSHIGASGSVIAQSAKVATSTIIQKASTTTAGAVIKTAGLTLGKKVLIGIVCAAVAAGGAGVAVHHTQGNQVKKAEYVGNESATTEEKQIVNNKYEDQYTVFPDGSYAFLYVGKNAQSNFKRYHTTDDDKCVEYIHVNEKDMTIRISENQGKTFEEYHMPLVLDSKSGIGPTYMVKVDDETALPQLYKVISGESNIISYKTSPQKLSNTELNEYVNYNNDMAGWIVHVVIVDNGWVEEVSLYKNIEGDQSGDDDSKTQDEDISGNTTLNNTLADGTYYPFFIGDKDRVDVPGVESIDTIFSWLEIGDSTMKINMDLGSGMQVYELPLASDVKFIESAGDDWEISADQLNSSFGKTGSLYGFNISLVMKDGKVKEVWTCS